MNGQPEFRNRTDITPHERADGVVVRRLVQGGSVDLTEYSAPRGFATGPSDHETHEKAGYIVSGTVEIHTPDGVQTLTAGGAYALPRGAPHQFVVIEDAVIVQVRAPASGPVS
jgi:quercetin dioxygenase-like cupin family protein